MKNQYIKPSFRGVQKTETKTAETVYVADSVPGYRNRKLIDGGSCSECCKGQGQYHDLDCSLDKSKG